jgi:hypothetical protein
MVTPAISTTITIAKTPTNVGIINQKGRLTPSQ